MPHLIPPSMLQPRPAEPQVLSYGRPEGAGIPAVLQWLMGLSLGAVVTLPAGVFFAFFAGGGPWNSALGAVLAALVLERYTAGLRRDPRLRPMTFAIRTGCACGFLLDCLLLSMIEWG